MTNPRAPRLRRTTTRVARAVAPALAILTMAAACAANGGSTATTASPDKTSTADNTQGPADGVSPVDGGEAVMGIEGEPEGLDPSRVAFAASGHYLASAVYEPLATVDAQGQAVPYLASAITPNTDRTVWTITLPRGVTFHNGTPLDAAAVKANLDAHRKSLITQLVMQTVTDVQAPDATHVVVTLDKPWVRFPNLLTSQIGYVLEPSMFTDPELSKKPIGSGPFVFDGHVDGSYWRFKKNPNYRRPGLPHLDSIRFNVLVDDDDRQHALENGDVDLIHVVKPDATRALKAKSEFKVVAYAKGEEDFLTLNTAKAPFDKLSARQAVAYATDSSTWIRDRTKGVEQPANSPYAPGQLGYEADNRFPKFDLEKAKSYVKQYEAETGQPLAFTYALTEGIDNQADAQFFQKQYEAAGMKVDIQTYKQIQLVAQTATGTFQMALFRNFGFHDPDTDATFFRSASALDLGGVSLNFSHYRDPEVDQVLDEALASPTDAERDQAYRKLQRIFATKLPYIWLGRPEWVLAANARVNGMYAAANGTVQTLGAKTWIPELWLKK